MNGSGMRPTQYKQHLENYPGNTYRSFPDLIQLEKIDERTYRSIAPPFAPGGPVGVGRSYGAHVYCQAAWAACQTVEKGFLLHNVSGNFILAGELSLPFVYKVHTIRNGRSYATRIVNATQSETAGICFTCICSFKTSEPRQIETQDSLHLYQQYDSVLQRQSPSVFPECPGMDLPFYRERRARTGLNDAFPGLESRKVDMAAYNKDRHPLDCRQLIFYRTLGDMPNEPNLHLCAHLYASDRNSLYIVGNHLDLGDIFTQMSSLVHTVVFHSPPEDLMFGPSSSSTSPMDENSGKWFCMEAWGSRVGSGRALYQCRIWDSQGRHSLTAMQDGILRFVTGNQVTEENEKILHDVKGRWKEKL